MEKQIIYPDGWIGGSQEIGPFDWEKSYAWPPGGTDRGL